MNVMFEILTATEMKKAEASAIAQGTSSFQLMLNAGTAASQVLLRLFQPCPVLVLCGPGNNGGDGFIIAQRLKKAGWSVRVACSIKRANLKNDAGQAALKWEGEIENLNSNLFVHQTGLIIDAVFGTGFGRELDPELKMLFDKIRTRKIPVVAVDIPSGINASTGTIDPGTLKAALTITFCRKKIAHVLMPSKNYCGDVVVSDIGITDNMIAELQTSRFENNPGLWLKDFPQPNAESHKYTRGHAIVYGGETRTGAACLAAAAAQKIGAGAVTIVSTAKSWPVYSSYRASLMVDECNDADAFKALLRDERKNVVLIGPGAGADDRLKQSLDSLFSFNKSGVLDADIFSLAAKSPKDLFSKLSPRYVLTPHEGEFEKLFGVMEGNKLERALKAAKMANAIVLLKGADTVIAAPDGAAVINTHAPSSLATAGSGDVLSGLITGLIAQGVPPFMAASAAVWLHSEAARKYGFCLTAEDIISVLPQALTSIFPND
jgi:hydroxyethylthiazole kinase-like uncharacterized protein yjeF